MYQPTLVIGLGGTGKNIILALKKMIAENCEHGMADFPFLELISLDTDEAIASAKSLIKTIKEEELTLNRNREVFKLHTNFGNVPNLNDYPKIHEWFPDSLKSYLMPAALSIGAGQKKPVGRFTFAWNAGELYERINRFIAAPVDAIEAKKKNIAGKLSHTINVFICGSVCGGTGAGSFLDMAYLIRHISALHSGNGFTVRVFGMFALASLFESVKGTPNVRKNCYASLQELDHFMNKVNFENPYRCFYPAYKSFPLMGDYGLAAQNKPFDHTFLFDKSGNGYSLPDVAAFSEMAARFIYLLTAHELSNHWFSMASNIFGEFKQDPDVNKSTEYYGMGTYSILYPKRMIVQLCAYNLSKEYLKKILEDNYAPQEIENLAKKFLKDIKMDAKSNQLENQFDDFKDSNFTGKFTDYIENEISGFSERSAETDKKDLKEALLQWKNDIEAKVVEFGNLNSMKSREIREGFISQLQLKLSEILDLHEHALGIKKDPNGNDLAERGSIVRAKKFVDCLITMFTESKEKYRKLRNDSESKINSAKAAFNEALEEFDEKTDAVFFANRKVAEAKEKVLEVTQELFIAQKQNFVYDWCYQLFDNIMFGAVPKYTGLIKELEDYQKMYQKSLNSFEELDKEISKFLDNNRNYKSTIFFDALFDYDKDVLGTCKKLFGENDKEKEDYVWETLSDNLTKDDCFKKDYTNTTNMTSSTINLDILRETEKFFFPLVNEVNIEDRVLESPDICKRLESGQYFDLAAIYLGLDGSVLSKLEINHKNETFCSISIPDEYEGRDCAGIKGDEAAQHGRRCPIDEGLLDPNKCNRYGKCLKQMLLMSQNSHISVTPTSEKSEINIIHTIAHYPLRAVASVMSNCKPEYDVEKKKQQQRNEDERTDFEEINMFGSLQFDALDEKTVDPRRKLDDFRKLLLVAYVARRLQIQALSVDFVTERDLAQDRKDKPSLHLGNSMNEVMTRFQSTRLSDKKDIEQFEKEINLLINDIKNDAETKRKFSDYAKETYNRINRELPTGFVQDDLDLLNEVVSDLCNITLIETKRVGIRLG